VCLDPAWEATERRDTVAYLRAAPACQSFLGYSTCHPCGLSGPELGAADLTDGTWIWPEGLPHCREQHALRPPEPFLVHLREIGFHMTGRILPLETALARLEPRVVSGMTRHDDEGAVRLRLMRPATPRDLHLGVEVDPALGCFRLDLNDDTLAAERQRTERLLNPPRWRQILRALFGL
jgi:hypothetical protein